MIALYVKISLQCRAVESKTYIVLKLAVNSNVVTADVHCSLAELEITWSECKHRVLYVHIRHILHFELHVIKAKATLRVYFLILFLLDA